MPATALGMNLVWGYAYTLDAGGVPIAGATITVYESGTLNLVTLYADSQGATPLANPTVSDSSGFYSAYCLAQKVDVRISGTDITTPYTIGDVMNLPQVPQVLTASLPAASATNKGALAYTTDARRGLQYSNGSTWQQVSLSSTECSILDYGAVNDGVTNCSAAVIAAYTAAQAIQGGRGTVYVPPGQFNLTSNVTIPETITLRMLGQFLITNCVLAIDGPLDAPDCAYIFNQQGTGTVHLTSGRHGTYATPQWFGADGLAHANDVPAFQRAIDALSTAQAGVLRIPAGGYLLTGAAIVVTAAQLTMQGVGNQATALYFNTDGINGIEVNTTGGFTICDLLTTTSITHTSGAAVVIGNTGYQSIGWRAERCTFDGHWVNFHLKSGSEGGFTDCIAQNCDKAQIRIQNVNTADSGENYIDGCVFGQSRVPSAGAAAYGIWHDNGGNGLAISDCKIQGGYGVGYFGDHVGVVRMHGNSFEDMSGPFIRLTESYIYNINGNEFRNPGTAAGVFQIEINSSTPTADGPSCRIHIDNNIFSANPNANGVLITKGHGTSIDGNTFDGGGAVAIRMSQAGEVINVGPGNVFTGWTTNFDGAAVATSQIKILDYGTYTPTLFNTTNVAASTSYEAWWTRIGNLVTVYGTVDIDPTAAAPTATVLGISLPIASNLGNTTQGTGQAVNDNFNVVGLMYSDAANDRMALAFNATNGNNQGFRYTFRYKIV